MLRIHSQVDREPIEKVRKLCLSVRKSRKLTQGQLAMRCGVSRKMIEGVEQERYKTAPRSLLLALQKVAEGVGEEVRGERGG
jgi:transcriptional regulator with XRE-family HTH domain